MGGRTVAEWQTVMTQAEFERWAEFYQMHPFDDLHRYYRPAALISRSMNGAEVEVLLEWLQPKQVEVEGVEGFSEADIRTMKALGMTMRKRG